MHNPYSIGNSLYLRAPTQEDVDGAWHEWFSDEVTTQFLADRFWPNTVYSQQNFFESLNNDKSKLVLSIVDIETDQHIGVCSLGQINWVHQYADFSLVIGEEQFRTGHAAIEAVDLLLAIGFNRLNLRNIKGCYVSINRLTCEISKLFNFKVVGKNENLLKYNGEYVDLIHIQLNQKNWLRRG